LSGKSGKMKKKFQKKETGDGGLGRGASLGGEIEGNNIKRAESSAVR